MTVAVFVDTNVLVHWRDPSSPDKHARATGWLAHLWETRRGRISYQVLNEYYTVATTKLKPGVRASDARIDIRNLFAWQPQVVDGEVLDAAWDVQDRFGFAFWDSLIVAAALTTGCRYLLTEDLQHGKDLGGLTVLSPFQATPADAS